MAESHVRIDPDSKRGSPRPCFKGCAGMQSGPVPPEGNNQSAFTAPRVSKGLRSTVCRLVITRRWIPHGGYQPRGNRTRIPGGPKGAPPGNHRFLGGCIHAPNGPSQHPPLFTRICPPLLCQETRATLSRHGGGLNTALLIDSGGEEIHRISGACVHPPRNR